MYDIPIPEELYERAAQAAKASHVTLQQFVIEAVQLHLVTESDDAIQKMFTPERLARIAQAEAEINAGAGLTPEQAREEFALKRAEWIRTHQAK